MNAKVLFGVGVAFSIASVAVEAQQARTPLPAKVPDSTFVSRSLLANEAELLRVVNEIRAREEALLRELESVPKDNESRRRSILMQLQNLNREAFTVMSVVEGQCIARRSSEPEGYMGVNISSSVQVSGNQSVVHQSIIESVELGSPADRAGLMAGDRLLSVGERDTRNALPALAGVLEPGRRIIVKVERQGQEVELPLVVGVRERNTRIVTCPQFERAMQPLRMGAVARTWVIDTTDSQGNRVVFVSPQPPIPRTGPAVPVPAAAAPNAPPTPATPSATPPVPSVVAAPAPPAPPMAFTFSAGGGSSISYFGGAQLRALDDDWRSVLGVSAGTVGVLVNEVAPGSAAAQAGLRVGDVITHVNGTEATSPFVASRLMGVSENRTAALRVIRARERRTVTMRWDG